MPHWAAKGWWCRDDLVVMAEILPGLCKRDGYSAYHAIFKDKITTTARELEL